MARRQLIMVNNSATPTTLAVLQNSGSEQATLVWLARYAYPGTQVTFEWDDQNFCFVWSAERNLAPGAVVQASQVVSATMNGNNAITLAYDSPNRSFYFKDQRAAQQQGILQITTDTSVPVNGCVAGIGMAGKPTVVVSTQPNINIIFTPHAKYAVLAGSIQEGEYIDLDTVHPTALDFPPNVWSVTATLSADGRWSFEQNVFLTADDNT
jgi:rhizosphere induced protein